ncbi:MAG: type I-E CRISPR-associated protein Cse1/CasA [Anaerolineae bacterium]
MAISFNLTNQPWVACTTLDGTTIELGLQDALAQAHELREVTGESPLVTASLHRLLLAVLHSIFGPADYKTWDSLWQSKRFEASKIADYFAHHYDRFDLFDAHRPFFQSADITTAPKSAASLIQEVASGNNATLFDHHTDNQIFTLTPSQAARYLVAAQSFGLAGLAGGGKNFTDGSCARGMIFLIQGQSLAETLLLNLMRYNDNSPMPRVGNDRPAWEMEDPFLPDRATPYGYLDYLTWQNRHIKLFPKEENSHVVVQQIAMAPALRLASDIRDPMKPYRRDEKRGLLPLRFNENRALWRDSATLFQLDTPGSYAPLAFNWLAQLADEGYLPDSTHQTIALGMANDQAKVEFYRTEQLSLPLIYLHDQELVNTLRDDVLGAAENVSRQLWGAARTMATYVLVPEADAENAHTPDPADLNRVAAPWGIERRYWSSLEIPFRHILEELPLARETALDHWQKTLRTTAWQVFNAAAQEVEIDPRAMKAVVRGREQLAAGLAKTLPA